MLSEFTDILWNEHLDCHIVRNVVCTTILNTNCAYGFFFNGLWKLYNKTIIYSTAQLSIICLLKEVYLAIALMKSILFL